MFATGTTCHILQVSPALCSLEVKAAIAAAMTEAMAALNPPPRARKSQCKAILLPDKDSDDSASSAESSASVKTHKRAWKQAKTPTKVGPSESKRGKHHPQGHIT